MSLKRLSFFFSLSGFLSALSFSTPIWMVFMTSYQHFSIETAINLSMITSFVMAVFEVWSGAWSDRFGRRWIFFLGAIFQIIATMVYILGHSLV
jgi:MFS family permease